MRLAVIPLFAALALPAIAEAPDAVDKVEALRREHRVWYWVFPCHAWTAPYVIAQPGWYCSPEDVSSHCLFDHPEADQEAAKRIDIDSELAKERAEG